MIRGSAKGRAGAAVGSIVVATLGGCSAGAPSGDASGTTTAENNGALGAANTRAALGALGKRYRLGALERGGLTRPSGGARDGDRKGQESAVQEGAGAVQQAPALEVTAPPRANEAFRVSDRTAGVSAAVELVGARAAAGEIAGDATLYPGATRDGAAMVQRRTATGVEDYVELPHAPDNGRVEYDVHLDAGVGLRLVEDTLELVDLEGTPRIRVSPPYFVGADGAVAHASLSVEGCAFDDDPSAPWGRVPVMPGADTCRVSVRVPDGLAFPALLDPAWNSAGNLADPRAGAEAVVLRNGRVLVAGGRGKDGSALDTAELYNPSTRSWATTSSLGSARADYTLTLRPNGQALAAGGRDRNGDVLGSSETYDATTGTWSAGADLAAPRADHRAIVLTSGDVLIAGGTTATAEKLSNATSTWSSAGTLISAASGHTLNLLPNGRVLLIGGAQAQSYDPATSHWFPSTGASGAVRVGHTTTTLASGQLLVVDDQNPSTELFSPASGAWSRPGAAVARRNGHTATLLADGRVLVAGGAPAGTSAFLGAELYTPAWGTFAPGPATLAARRDHVEALLSSGKVLLAGGVDPNTETVLASAEEFDPKALAATIAEYKFPARVDAEVLSDRATELWASVTRPAALVSGKRYPLLVFLHGNHGTCGSGTNPRHDFDCTYTDTGTCPTGFVVTPNHRGYDYLTNELAGRGFIVVSINANRGINCAGGSPDDGGLNLARGRLILRHLEALSSWNRGAAPTPASLGVDLRGALDFSQVGLLGHSRGGEGVRAAYEQYQDAGSPWPARLVDPLRVRAAFEIGPVDGQTSRTLNANGAVWNVLLPMCDGDVSDLEGVKPFDRMLQNTTSTSAGAKSTYTVWGANHNFYNTEWQDSDSGGCTDHRALFSADASGSAEQRQTAMQAVVSFFTANVGTSPSSELEDLFNPELRVSYDSPVQRGYAPDASATQVLEEFNKPNGTSSFGIRNVTSRVTVTHDTLPEHDGSLHGATVTWTGASASTYFQVNFANPGAGLDLSSFGLLDFRVDRAKNGLNTAATTSFEVALVNADNSVSALVSTTGYGDTVTGPVGGPYGNYHEMLSTIRIPLARFSGATLQAVRGVRFVFRTTPAGVIYLANVRATRSTLVGPPSLSGLVATATPQVTSAATPGTGSANFAPSAAPAGARPLALATEVTTGNSVKSLRTSADATAVEIALTSSTPFLPRAALLTLEAGDNVSQLSRHPGGDLGQVTFVVPKATFDALPDGQPLRVRYAGGAGNVWVFGALDKQKLDR
ncbi:MAG TPA: kelch repeat-containing protein [Polyangiaceae bacterium]|nr:kelch repeat-containing protein [Polyangiaceae bacterium]